MTTQDRGSEERGLRPPLPPEGSTEPEVRAAQATEGFRYGKALEVPIAYVTIQPLAWEDDDHVRRDLRCVTVDANIAVEETVSVVLTSPCDPASGISDGHEGMVFFDLEPLDALLLADELRRAAEESVAPCPCGRTLANMRDFTDVCLLSEQPATGTGGAESTVGPCSTRPPRSAR